MYIVIFALAQLFIGSRMVGITRHINAKLRDMIKCGCYSHFYEEPCR